LPRHHNTDAHEEGFGRRDAVVVSSKTSQTGGLEREKRSQAEGFRCENDRGGVQSLGCAGRAIEYREIDARGHRTEDVRRDQFDSGVEFHGQRQDESTQPTVSTVDA